MSMVDLTQLNDDDLRAALFDALVKRLDEKALNDPSIAVVNRMPTAFAVSRRGNLLTLTQGLGLRLLRGDLKWKNRREPRTFTVDRATIRSRLAFMPDRIEGTPDEILDRVVMMFLEWTATEVGEEHQPAWDKVTDEIKSASSVAPKPSAVRPPPQHPPPIRRTTTTPNLRTYQLLFETTQLALLRAEAVPASSMQALISAGVFVALTAEAFFNDLGSRVIPSWSQLQRLDPREKAEVLSIELFNAKVNWSIRPFQSVAEALGFRRALAHAHAETLSVDRVPTADRKETEVPRTRRTAWQEHCDVATIQRWVTDVRLLIEHFSKGHDPTEVALGMTE
jgi:hypothetical protein